MALAALLTTAALPTSAGDAAADERLRTLARDVEKAAAAPNANEMYVMTDKPLYHPGEAIWFRAWEIAVSSFAPKPTHGITFQLLDPRGSKVAEKRVQDAAGVATNDFELGEGAVGGQYTLRAISDLGMTLDKPLIVSTYEAPRVKKTVEFTRKSYGPGDNVTVRLELTSATGEPLYGAKVVSTITIDGAEIARFVTPIDPKGNGAVRFMLPPHMARGDGLLTISVDAGGVNEATQRRIPITLSDVRAQLFPEGGDLVNGVPSRVYVAVKDPIDRPAEFEGDVLDDRGKSLGHVKSFYGGMARFLMTPESGRHYTLQITKPAKAAFPLPEAKSAGCTMQSVDDYASKGADLRLSVACSGFKHLLATAVLREKLVAQTAFDAQAGGSVPVTLALPQGSTGAVRVTLFDDGKSPLAERLVYRGLGGELHVEIIPDRASYSPRERVGMTVKTTDASGRPVTADVAVAVVDDTVLSFADDKSPNILAGLYLLPEMPGQTIKEPNFYFSKDKKAPEAMDLLLGTQGYRRFEWKWVNQNAQAR